MADRVDKSWQAKGLEGYSTGAILGTLAHYGVSVDEAAFKEASKDAYPAQVATAWTPQWKGTGQFKAFPYAAAVELYRRAWPDRLVPSALAEGLSRLLAALHEVLDGEEAEPSYEEVAGLAERLPPQPEQRARFLEEALTLLGEEVLRTFDEMAETLADSGHGEEARRFAALEEQLLPERKGISSAIVRAALGERDEAVAQLQGLLAEADADAERRVMAVDGLIHLEELEKAKAAAEPLLDQAEARKDFHLALALCERLAHVYEKLSAWPELKALADRAQALAKAHDEAHPDHRHQHG